MTVDEAVERYSIPRELLCEYESWGLREFGSTVGFGDRDLELLGAAAGLLELGFSVEEAGTCLRQMVGHAPAGVGLNLLDAKRRATLDEIHRLERRLEKLDFLRHELAVPDETRRAKDRDNNIL